MTHFVSLYLTNRGKNKDEEDKKIWKDEFNLWILRIKIRLYGNFHENLRKKWNGKVLQLVHYLTLTICLIKMGKKLIQKWRWQWKSLEEWTWFLRSKLGYTEIFMKIYEKKVLTNFLGHFWLVEAKIKIKIRTFGKMSLIFEFSILKLGYMKVFMKI